MKNKFTYINTIVLLFLSKYNTEHAELETCGKTEIQLIQLNEDTFCVYSE